MADLKRSGTVNMVSGASLTVDIRVTNAETEEDAQRIMQEYLEAIVQMPRRHAIPLNLCEAFRLVLRPDQAYFFTVDPTCSSCVAAAKAAEGE